MTDSTDTLRLYGLTLLRVVVGAVFIAHGVQKLIFMGIPNVAGFLGQLGVPQPNIAAIVLTVAESLGGVSLVLGAFTRYAAFVLAFDMAILLVHSKNGFFLPDGFEYAMVLLGANLCLVLSGGGALEVAGS